MEFQKKQIVEGIILIISCQKHEKTRLKEFRLKNNEYSGWKVIYVLGDFFLECKYKLNENLMTVKCEDSYIHLFKKLVLSIKYIYEIYEIKQGVLRCGDDLVFNEDNLTKFLEIPIKLDLMGCSPVKHSIFNPKLSQLKEVKEVTLSCAEGEQGNVYRGILDFEIERIKIDNNLKLPVKLMLNVGNPENSFNSSIIPNSGVGLARLEFIISNYIKIHPIALCNYPNIRPDIREKIYEMIGSHDNGKWYFITRLARGISKIAAAFYPNDVIVRLSDFKSNEYRNLVGGELYEPNEENPMIGWRGASRYYSPDYEQGFELECEAIKYAREEMKMTNIIVMIPFCRTPKECQLVIDKMESYGLKRGEKGLQIYLMCEIPSNVIEANEFSPMIDGVSIGGNDLLQLTLGVDRDSDKITYLSSDENLSYRRMISMAIKTYKANGIKIGFCGQQPSDSTEFCQFLINEKIDSISVTPDSALKTIKNLGSTF